MANVVITCPACSAKLRLAKPLTPGQSIKCPKCQRGFKARGAAPQPSPAGIKPVQAGITPVPAPIVAVSPGVQAGVQRGRGNMLAVWISIAVVAFFILAGGAAVGAWLLINAANQKTTVADDDPPVKPRPPQPPVKKGDETPDPKPKPKDDWIVHKSISTGTQAEFPIAPKEISYNGSPPMREVMCDWIKDKRFLARYSIRVANLKPDQVGMSAAALVKETALSFGKIPIKFEPWQSHPAMEVRIAATMNDPLARRPGPTITVLTTKRIFYRNGKQYQLSVSQSPTQKDPLAVQRFFDSFDIVGEPVLAANPKPKDDWPVYTSANTGTKASFPMKPQFDTVDKQEFPPVASVECEWLKGKQYLGTYAVTVINIEKNQKNLDNDRLAMETAEIYKGPNSTVKFNNRGKGPGFDVFQMDTRNGKINGEPVHVTMHVFFVKDRSYQLIVHQPKGKQDPKLVERFFNSFQIVANPKLPASSKPKGDIILAKLGGTTHLAVSPKETLFATAGEIPGGKLRVVVWDAKTGKMHKYLDQSAGDFQEMAFSSNDRYLACLCQRGTKINIWDLATGTMMDTKSLPKKKGELHEASHCFAFRPDGKSLIVAHNGLPLRVDLEMNKIESLAPKWMPEPGNRFAYSPAKDTLAAARYVRQGGFNVSAELFALQLATKKSRKVGVIPEVGMLAFSANGKALAASIQSPEGKVAVFDTTNWKVLATVQKPSKSGVAARPLTMSPDGKYVAAVTRDELGDTGTVEIWQVAGKKHVKSIPALFIDELQMAPDGRTLMICSTSPPYLRYYDITTGAVSKSPW